MSIELFKPLNVKQEIVKFDPDKRIDVKENLLERTDNSFNPDKKMEKFYTTYEERINQTPKDLSRWVNNRGESLCFPTTQDVKEELAKFGLQGIEYKNGMANFEECSLTKAKINMTSERYGIGGNFEKANTELAKQFNRQEKEGRNDWTSRECENWRKENNLTWHECVDGETCLLIPQVIHNDFSHIGGVAECKRKEEILDNKKGVTFDE